MMIHSFSRPITSFILHTQICFSPYDNRWSKTMVGYGIEDTHFVVELTYNYNVNSYDLGNDFLGLTIRSSEALANAKKQNWPVEEKDGCSVIRAPGGYAFNLINEPQPTDKGSSSFLSVINNYAISYSKMVFLDPVEKVTLASSNLQKSVNYWNKVLGLKIVNQCDKSVVVGFDENQAKLELTDIGT